MGPSSHVTSGGCLGSPCPSASLSAVGRWMDAWDQGCQVKFLALTCILKDLGKLSVAFQRNFFLWSL